ncbi:hypothetical protein TNCV_2492031 [Trichonephila clavipes]|nr:hypothetical protein TNCV_2492031 [Trichonephila clavipes]
MQVSLVPACEDNREVPAFRFSQRRIKKRFPVFSPAMLRNCGDSSERTFREKRRLPPHKKSTLGPVPTHADSP